MMGPQTAQKFIITAAVGLGLLAGAPGCATAPVQREFERSTVLEGVSFDAVWNEVIDLFGERAWPIANVEKASGFINTDWMRVVGSERYYDCGSPGISVQTEPTGRFNVVVRQEGGTKVTVNTVWRTTRELPGNTVVNVDCLSTGVLEAEIHQEIARRTSAAM